MSQRRWAGRAGAAVVLLAVACSGTSGNERDNPSSPVGSSDSLPSEPGTRPPEPGISSRFEFEAEIEPSEWLILGDNVKIGVDRSQAYAGASSLRIAKTGQGNSGVASRSFPVEAARGKHVALTGYVKTENVENGWAGIWLRVDGPSGPLSLQNMEAEAPKGNTPWTKYTVSLDVPESATAVKFGALLVGQGVAWYDEMELTVLATDLVSVAGRVVSDDGKPVTGAIVAIVGDGASRATATATTDADGTFAIDVPPGAYAVTASAGALTASHRPVETIGRDVVGLELVLGGDGDRISGRVTTPEGTPIAQATMRVIRYSFSEGDIFYTTTSGAGTYEISIPKGFGYAVYVDQDGHSIGPTEAMGSSDHTIDVSVAKIEPAPEVVVHWLKENAMPIGIGENVDVSALTGSFRKARIVGVGEATHGTREFAQFRFALLRMLVEKNGFRALVLEADAPEIEPINRYVLGGDGDPRKLVDELTFWMWKTEEMVATLTWLREYNARHSAKVQVYGCDVQISGPSARRLAAYLTRVELPELSRYEKILGILQQENAPLTIYNMPEKERSVIRQDLQAIGDVLQEREKAFVRATSREAWETAARDLEFLQKTILVAAEGPTGNLRDEFMAKNVSLIASTTANGKVVVWAHNGHVAVEPIRKGGDIPFGVHLRREFGAGYMSVGFLFNYGAFRASDARKPSANFGKVTTFTVDRAPPGDLGAEFARTGLPSFAINVGRKRLVGAPGEWLLQPHPWLMVGAAFTQREDFTDTIALGANFDLLVFFDKTQASTPLEVH